MHVKFLRYVDCRNANEQWNRLYFSAREYPALQHAPRNEASKWLRLGCRYGHTRAQHWRFSGPMHFHQRADTFNILLRRHVRSARTSRNGRQWEPKIALSGDDCTGLEYVGIIDRSMNIDRRLERIIGRQFRHQRIGKLV